MSYDNTNTGILSANERRRNDRDPTHQGSINIDGKEYWLSAWVNTGKDGGKLAGKRYFSIKVRSKDQGASDAGYDVKAAEQRERDRRRETPQAAAAGDFSDDIPF